MNGHSPLCLVDINLVRQVSAAWNFSLKGHTRDRAFLPCYMDLLLSDLRPYLTEGDNVRSLRQDGGHLKWALKSI